MALDNHAVLNHCDSTGSQEPRLVCSSSTVHQERTPSNSNNAPRSRPTLGGFGNDLNFGLMITLKNNNNDDNNNNNTICQLTFCSDAHYPDIHPNAYAPEALTNMRKLGGGGSGVAVFEGHHPQLGDIVMKHGGDKDLQELFALATISEELTARGKMAVNRTTTTTTTTKTEHTTSYNTNDNNDETIDNSTAAQHLQERIPAFRMIYISPNHLGEKRRELWHRLAHLYKYSSRNLLLLSQEDELFEDHETKEQCNSGHVTSTHDHGARRHSSLEFGLKPVAEEIVDKDKDKTTANGTDDKAVDVPSLSASMINRFPKVSSRNALVMTQSGTVSGHRDISIYRQGEKADDEKCCSVSLLGDSLTLTISNNDNDKNGSQQTENADNDGVTKPIQIPGNGYQALDAIVQDLYALMKEHKWKFTLGQKRIGGSGNPKTGNQWLYAGKLEGALLDNLISQQIQLVRDLATLTTAEEQDPAVVRRIQRDVARFEEEDITVADISNETDSFVANSIKKNFQAEVGRISVLSQLGRQFRDLNMQNSHSSLKKVSSESSVNDLLPRALHPEDESMLILSDEEEIPAHHLGSLTRMGAFMGDTFENVPPFEVTALEMNPFVWRNILRQAIQPRRRQLMGRTSTMSLTRIWTCGLTDAGVHNLFLDQTSISLFDLGSPQLYSAPGFLTKFLFSFFHTLGMEEDPDDSDTWVRRFEHNHITGKLRKTYETNTLLKHAYSAFETTLDRVILELFDGDDSLRWLLIQYMTLQLISDASFCLQRWTIKGGGRTRDANHQTGIEKWLWRALWDLYVAFDLNTSETWTRLGVLHPSNRESVYFADMKDLVFDPETLATLQAGMGDDSETKDETA